MTKFYGIGTGPGDSDLLTIRGKNTLEKIDILYTPESKKEGKSLALSIVTPYLKSDLTIKQRHFPMSNDQQSKEKAWDSIAEEIIADVQSGKDVGFITLGDPMIYSTYSYLLERVKKVIETETIAGISSFSQIASQLQMPLVLDDETYAVVPATAEEAFLRQALENFTTIIIMKIALAVPKIKVLLEELDLSDQTILISNVSMDGQEVIKGMRSISEEDKLSYFTTAIVYKNRC
ncbi:cobalt-factor II C(20)-methyltransferase [Enterococcus casseliflavus]|uniref:cobalt-factor II C(20)-methyltransferase n=1 Tax=Enterococcus casseliflavus TaxID=37734 RepID=UPI0022E77173|nr:cobalt-factor II C(20)-methyltransferase [Enterococcus casseliflavus]MEB6086007.1 cobalt-factor II C(20)-methyltransferase [Enterococcus casseliflavus]